MFLRRLPQMFAKSCRVAVRRANGTRANAIQPLFSLDAAPRNAFNHLTIVADAAWQQERWALPEHDASSEDASETFVWWMANTDPCAFESTLQLAPVDDHESSNLHELNASDNEDWPVQWWMANTDPYAFQGTPDSAEC